MWASKREVELGVVKPLRGTRKQNNKGNVILTAKTDVYSSERSINNNKTRPSIPSNSVKRRKIGLIYSLIPLRRPALVQQVENID